MRGKLVTVRARGDLAHFCGINFGPERHTMIVPSHSACVGILRSVLGKREMRWCVESASLLSSPDVFPLLQNELQDFRSKNFEPVDITEKRTQRVRTFLCSPDFVIRARIALSANAGSDDTLAKFYNMFDTRIRRGYQHSQPYFGIRECTAYLSLVEDGEELPAPTDVSRDYGISFYDIDLDDPEEPSYLAPLRVEHGVVRYPTMEEVRKLGLRYELRRVA